MKFFPTSALFLTLSLAASQAYGGVLDERRPYHARAAEYLFNTANAAANSRYLSSHTMGVGGAENGAQFTCQQIKTPGTNESVSLTITAHKEKHTHTVMLSRTEGAAQEHSVFHLFYDNEIKDTSIVYNHLNTHVLGRLVGGLVARSMQPIPRERMKLASEATPEIHKEWFDGGIADLISTLRHINATDEIIEAVKICLQKPMNDDGTWKLPVQHLR